MTDKRNYTNDGENINPPDTVINLNLEQLTDSDTWTI